MSVLALKNKTKPQLRKIASRWQLYLLLLLPVAYIIIFAYVPMTGIQLAFKRFVATEGIWGSPWIGLDNFRRFLSSYQFERVFFNTIKISLYGLIAGFPIPIIFALTLNAMMHARLKKFIQTVTYIPHFISTVVLVGMLMQFINPRIGIFGVIYTAVTGQDAPNLIGQASAFSHLYVWSGIWQSMGWSSIIYMAALAGVDPELHEAAVIDGASRFRRVLHIDFPCILPTAAILLIISAGNIMDVGFEKIFLMQNDLNRSASEVISTYVYRVGIGVGTGLSGQFSYATAIGLFNSLINFVLICTVNAISKKISEHSLW